MKSAEFTDRASASAFLTAGRKKGERSTNDGWNTVLYEEGTDYVLKLHGTEIVRYGVGQTTITIPMRNHVVADRIQRYGFADQFKLITGPKWSLNQAWGKMRGITEDPTIWYPVAGEVPNVVTIDASGALLVPTAPPMPGILSVLDRARIFEPAIKQWLGKAMKLLDAGWNFDSSEWHTCPLCDGVEGPGHAMLAWNASHNHLMSHVLEGVVLPSTVAGLMLTTSFGHRSLNLVVTSSGDGSMGAGSSIYNHDATRRTLKNALRAATR